MGLKLLLALVLSLLLDAQAAPSGKYVGEQHRARIERSSIPEFGPADETEGMVKRVLGLFLKQEHDQRSLGQHDSSSVQKKQHEIDERSSIPEFAAEDPGHMSMVKRLLKLFSGNEDESSSGQRHSKRGNTPDKNYWPATHGKRTNDQEWGEAEYPADMDTSNLDKRKDLTRRQELKELITALKSLETNEIEN